MNKFDALFFKRYIGNDEIKNVFHQHMILVLDNIVFWSFIGVIIPSFFYYYNSFNLQVFLPFGYFEIYLFIIWGIIMYQIFDWYNDVWIITNNGVTRLDWKMFSTKTSFIDFGNIEGIESNENNFTDSLLGTKEITLHIIGGNITFPRAAHPKKIIEIIRNGIDRNNFQDEEENHDIHAPEFQAILKAMKEVVREKIDENSFIEEEKKERLEEILSKKNTLDLRTLSNEGKNNIDSDTDLDLN